MVLRFGTHNYKLNLLDPLINVYITTPKNTYIIYSVMLKATKTTSFHYCCLNGIVRDLNYIEYDSNFPDYAKPNRYHFQIRNLKYRARKISFI